MARLLPTGPRVVRRRAVAMAATAGLGAVLAALGGCGTGGPDAGRPDQAARLLLDGPAAAVHVGIYEAVARDFTGAEGVTLSVQAPAAGPRPAGVRMLTTGRTDFAILDIHDLARAQAARQDVVGVMAIVEQPLSAVVARPGVRRPRDLQGRRVGVGPSRVDRAVVRAIVRGDGGDASRVGVRPVARDAAAGLGGGAAGARLDAAVAPWNTTGADLQARRADVRAFHLDDFGAPAFPELVLATTRTLVQDRPALVRATVTALQRGYRDAISDPERAVAALSEAVPGTDRAKAALELDAVQQAFQATDGRIGTLDRQVLDAWARWELRQGLVRRLPDVLQAFAPRFAALGAAKAAQNSG